MAVLGNSRHELAAEVLARGGSAKAAAAAAGYKTEARSFESNARKFIQREDLRERVKELQGEVAAKLVDVTVEFIEQGFAKIAATEVLPHDIRASDVIAALRELAKIKGIYAPEKTELSGADGGPIITTITRTIVEPRHSDSDGLSPSPTAGAL